MTADRRSELPSITELVDVVVQACQSLGGPATSREIDVEAIAALRIDTDLQTIPHQVGRKRSEISYRLAWARTKAKTEGRLVRRDDSRWSSQT